MTKKWNWTKYLMEFVSIFVAVISAFALSNWSENQRDHEAASKILIEISNGLEKDLKDIDINMAGHQEGIKACGYWKKVFMGQEADPKVALQYYLSLTRDFISVQNSSGYETLKSRGLELVQNDSLRSEIISLYEYDYHTIKTMEEDYFEMQFTENYSKEFNEVITPHFEFDYNGGISKFNLPIELNEKQRNKLLTYLFKMAVNRRSMIFFYSSIKKKIENIRQKVDQEIQ